MSCCELFDKSSLTLLIVSIDISSIMLFTPVETAIIQSTRERLVSNSHLVLVVFRICRNHVHRHVTLVTKSDFSKLRFSEIQAEQEQVCSAGGVKVSSTC